MCIRSSSREHIEEGAPKLAAVAAAAADEYMPRDDDDDSNDDELILNYDNHDRGGVKYCYSTPLSVLKRLGLAGGDWG